MTLDDFLKIPLLYNGYVEGFRYVSFWDVDMKEVVTLDCVDLVSFDMSIEKGCVNVAAYYDLLYFEADPESVVFHNIIQ